MTYAAAPVAVLGSHQLVIFFLQAGILLLLALLLGKVTARLGLTAIVGELLVGVLLGPSVLAHLSPAFAGWLIPRAPGQFHLLDVVGQLGVVLLVGIAGIRMDLGLVRRRGRAAATVGVSALILPAGLGVAIAIGLPGTLVPAHTDRTTLALFLGVAFGVSAIPVIARILLDMGLLHRNIGQLIVCAATIDDVAGWLLLSVCAFAAAGGIHPGSVAALLVRFGLLVLATIVLRPVLQIALRLVARFPGDGATITLVVAALMLAAAGTQALGFESVIGAFACGIVVRSCPGFDPARLEPISVTVLAVFGPLYFAIAGLRMDLTALARPEVLLAGVVMLIAATAGKAVGGYSGARWSRLSHWEAVALGAGVNSRGIVEVVVATTGLRLGVLDQRLYTIIVMIAILTSAMAPPVLRWSMAHVEYTAEERLRLALTEPGADHNRERASALTAARSSPPSTR